MLNLKYDKDDMDEELDDLYRPTETDDTEDPLDQLVVDESDLSWGAVRRKNKEHFCIRKRKAIALWAFSLFTIALIIGLVVMAAILIEEHENETSDPKYTDLKVEKWKVGPINIPAGDAHRGFFYDIPRPQGNVTIRSVSLDIVDEWGRAVPLEQLYNHHIFLGAAHNRTGRIIAAVGAEGARIPIKLPKPYGVPSHDDEPWIMSFHLINQWGLASGANLTVYISYEVGYTPSINPSESVNWKLLGLDLYSDERNQTFEWDIPGNGGLHSAVELKNDYLWGPVAGTVVFTWGHVHIGALNTTLYDISDPNNVEVVCVSLPQYSPTGFITSIERRDRVHTFPKGGKFRIVSFYDNSRNYGRVMSLAATYTTVDIQGEGTNGEDARNRREREQFMKVVEYFGSTFVPPFMQ